jgi:hypothetical protein
VIEIDLPGNWRAVEALVASAAGVRRLAASLRLWLAQEIFRRLYPRDEQITGVAMTDTRYVTADLVDVNQAGILLTSSNDVYLMNRT